MESAKTSGGIGRHHICGYDPITKIKAPKAKNKVRIDSAPTPEFRRIEFQGPPARNTSEDSLTYGEVVFMDSCSAGANGTKTQRTSLQNNAVSQLVANSVDSTGWTAARRPDQHSRYDPIGLPESDGKTAINEKTSALRGRPGGSRDTPLFRTLSELEDEKCWATIPRTTKSTIINEYRRTESNKNRLAGKRKELLKDGYKEVYNGFLSTTSTALMTTSPQIWRRRKHT